MNCQRCGQQHCKCKYLDNMQDFANAPFAAKRIEELLRQVEAEESSERRWAEHYFSQFELVNKCNDRLETQNKLMREALERIATPLPNADHVHLTETWLKLHWRMICEYQHIAKEALDALKEGK